MTPFKRFRGHIRLHHLIRDRLLSLLERRNERLQLLDAPRFQLSRQQFSFKIRLANRLDILVILEEEGQVLERDVDVWVSTKLALLFTGSLAAGEGIFVDLLLTVYRWVMGQCSSV